MRNDNLKSKVDKIIDCVKNLPYFSKKNMEVLGEKEYYLKIVLSRLEKKGKVIRLKRGMYVLKDFIDRTKMSNRFSDYLEFISSKIYFPSYLSLEYVLYENNILTDIPQRFTLVTNRKTYIIRNKFGTFIYHKIKDEFFKDYIVERRGDFLVFKADKIKALFDFLYLRKDIILNKDMAKELRLNIDVFTRNETKKLAEYIELEGSRRMKEIYKYIFEDA